MFWIDDHNLLIIACYLQDGSASFGESSSGFTSLCISGDPLATREETPVVGPLAPPVVVLAESLAPA